MKTKKEIISQMISDFKRNYKITRLTSSLKTAVLKCDIEKVKEILNYNKQYHLRIRKMHKEEQLRIKKEEIAAIKKSRDNINILTDIQRKSLAIMTQNLKELKSLFNKDNIDYNETRMKDSALMYATSKNKLKSVKFLIDLGADVNIIDRFEDTALLIALKQDVLNIDLIKLLIEAGSDLTISDRYDKNLIYFMKDSKRGPLLKFIKGYNFQNTLLNGKEKVLLSLNNLGLVNNKIKKENPSLFEANSWGLI